MSFHSVQIAQLLRGSQLRSLPEPSAATSIKQEPCAVENFANVDDMHQIGDGATCDVSYVLFLEPPSTPDPDMTLPESCIDTAIRVFQPVPAMAHCELLIPPLPEHEAVRSQFATYIGKTSAWQTDKVDGYNYYLLSNMGRWRAVPVFGKDIAQRLRRECDQEIGVAYSLARYVTSARPMRFFASMLPDKRRSPAHCATLAARVLRKALPGSLEHSAAWYGPSSLYLETCEKTREKAAQLGVGGGIAAAMAPQTGSAIDSLLRGQMSHEAVSSLGDKSCMDATRALTLRVCNDLVEGDSMAQRISQKQLASALLRWVLLRSSD